MDARPTAPNGAPISIRPILSRELDRVVLRCWPDRAALERLFATQATIGMAAWEGRCCTAERCVAQLHGYRVDLPDGENEGWPPWNNWWSDAARGAVANLRGPAWCHACIHVGRTLASARQETLGLLYRFAGRNEWNPARTRAALNALDNVEFTLEEIEVLIRELQASGQTRFQSVETQYQGRGIGTALCQTSVQWAHENGYAWVLAIGAPDGLRAYARFAGCLPWTTYSRLGFQSLPQEDQDRLPAWVQRAGPPEVVAEVQAALKAGRAPSTFHERLMALDLDS